MLHPFFNIDRPVIPKPAQVCKYSSQCLSNRKIMLRYPFTKDQHGRPQVSSVDLNLRVRGWDCCGRIFCSFLRQLRRILKPGREMVIETWSTIVRWDSSNRLMNINFKIYTVHAAQTGSEEVWRQLFERHFDAVCRLCFALEDGQRIVEISMRSCYNVTPATLSEW